MIYNIHKYLNTRENITLSRNATNVPSTSVYTCYLDKKNNRVYFYAYINPRNTQVYTSGNNYTLWTVPEGFRPKKTIPLSAYVGNASVPNASITTAGEIRVMPKVVDIGTSWAVMINGYWDL